MCTRTYLRCLEYDQFSKCPPSEQANFRINRTSVKAPTVFDDSHTGSALGSPIGGAGSCLKLNKFKKSMLLRFSTIFMRLNFKNDFN